LQYSETHIQALDLLRCIAGYSFSDAYQVLQSLRKSFSSQGSWTYKDTALLIRELSSSPHLGIGNEIQHCAVLISAAALGLLSFSEDLRRLDFRSLPSTLLFAVSDQKRVLYDVLYDFRVMVVAGVCNFATIVAQYSSDWIDLFCHDDVFSSQLAVSFQASPPLPYADCWDQIEDSILSKSLDLLCTGTPNQRRNLCATFSHTCPTAGSMLHFLGLSHRWEDWELLGLASRFGMLLMVPGTKQCSTRECVSMIQNANLSPETLLSVVANIRSYLVSPVSPMRKSSLSEISGLWAEAKQQKNNTQTNGRQICHLQRDVLRELVPPLAVNVFRTASADSSALLGLVNDCELFDFQESLLIWRSLVSMSGPFLAVMKSLVEAAGKLSQDDYRKMFSVCIEFLRTTAASNPDEILVFFAALRKMVSILQPDKWRTMRNSLCDKATELVTGYEASAVLLNCSEFGASLLDAQQDTVVDAKQKTVAGVYLNAIEHHTNKCMSLADFCNVVKKTYCCNLQDLCQRLQPNR
jgi:hypothetical protein